MPGRYQRRPKRNFKRKPRVNKTKQLVTGQGPTLLERIASGLGGAANVARAVMPIVAAINTEMKYIDTSISTSFYNPGTSSQIAQISMIAQDTTETGRIGNSILAKEVYLKGHVNWTASTTIHTGVSRVTLVVWKSNNEENPITEAKVFEAPTAIHSAINKDYSDQLVVLFDKLFVHQASISAATQQSAFKLKYYKKLDFHLRFDGTTSGDGTVNHLFLIFRGDAAAAANQSGATIYSRLNYTDN